MGRRAAFTTAAQEGDKDDEAQNRATNYVNECGRLTLLLCRTNVVDCAPELTLAHWHHGVGAVFELS